MRMHIRKARSDICHPSRMRSVAAMDWRHHAVCRDEDPELFFPIGTSGPALLQVEQAKAVCRRCSVTDECLKWALESGQDAGVWGGMSEEERRAVKRRGGLRVLRAHSA
jgi:WhiB family transcriptional regulator, redox-sensing transcriptional regulator